MNWSNSVYACRYRPDFVFNPSMMRYFLFVCLLSSFLGSGMLIALLFSCRSVHIVLVNGSTHIVVFIHVTGNGDLVIRVLISTARLFHI